MPILERLSHEPPRHKTPGSFFDPKCRIARKYLKDIEQAKAQGYSWNQIKWAVIAEAKAEGIWKNESTTWCLGDVYRRIKKEDA